MPGKRTSGTRKQRQTSSTERSGLIAKGKKLLQSARATIALDTRSHRTKQG
jgi:hypothetical protein